MSFSKTSVKKDKKLLENQYTYPIPLREVRLKAFNIDLAPFKLFTLRFNRFYILNENFFTMYLLSIVSLVYLNDFDERIISQVSFILYIEAFLKF